jgi:hypothetical protein
MSTPNAAISAAVEEAQKSVVQLLDAKTNRPVGSGVIVNSTNGKTFISTNDHVVQENTAVKVVMPDGNTFTATVRPERVSGADLALVQLSRDGYANNVAKLQEKGRDPAVGSAVYSVGYPYSEQDKVVRQAAVLTNQDVVQDGIKLSFAAPKNTLEKGMSGGGTFNDKGVFVGINTTHPALWGATATNPLEAQYEKNSGFTDVDALRTLMQRAGVPAKEAATQLQSNAVALQENPSVRGMVNATPPLQINPNLIGAQNNAFPSSPQLVAALPNEARNTAGIDHASIGSIKQPDAPKAAESVQQFADRMRLIAGIGSTERQ